MTADRSPADVAREIADSIVPDDPLSHTILFSRPDLHGRLTTAIASALRTAEQRVWEEAVELCDDIADQAQTDGQELGALRCRDACHIHVKQEKAGG